MKPSAPFPSDNAEAVEAMAAAWLAERDAGLSPEQEAEFARWRAADARHEAAVTRLENSWQALQPLREFRPAAGRHPDINLLERRPVAVPVRFPGWVGGLAAAAAVALAVVAFWARPDPESAVPARYVTAPGGYSRSTLPDGSVVDLNTDSELRIDFSGPERRVRLLRGEAMFTVAKNPDRPFLVQAGVVTVRAVGTAFNVKHAPAGVEVLVTEGKVQVRSELAGPAAAEPLLLTANQKTLVPTTVAVAETTAPVLPLVEKVTEPALREALAWQEPRLRFVDTPLREAVRQFNQRNRVQLVLGDRVVGDLAVDGSFRPDNVEGFARLLAEEGSVIAERMDETHIVLRKAP